VARRRAGSVIQEGQFVDRSQVVSNRLGDNDRAKPSASGSGVESVPPSGAAPSPPEILGRSPEMRGVFTGTKPPPLGAPLPPPDRNHRPPLGSAPAAPEAPVEVENLHCASPAMKRGRRRCRGRTEPRGLRAGNYSYSGNYSYYVHVIWLTTLPPGARYEQRGTTFTRAISPSCPKTQRAGGSIPFARHPRRPARTRRAL
jgi:hypothetical protein